MSKDTIAAPKSETSLNKPTAASVFSGAGGLDIGFNDAGFEVVVAIENWKPACDTYRKNFPGTTMIEGDITDHKIKDQVVESLKGQAVDVVFGGPPCTGFSLLGRRDPKAKCNYLYRDYLDIVDKIRPAVFVIENVEGILSMPLSDGQHAIEAIVASASKMGYRVEHRILVAADYGAPQSRKRVILLGSRYDVPLKFPEPTHGPVGSGLKPYVTVRDAIGDIEGKAEDVIFSHIFTSHSPKLAERIQKTGVGKPLYTRNHGLRLDPDIPAPTMTNNNGSTMIHYALDRMITPRECARLQGFPDTHIFCGSKNDAGKQIGNAVPCALARAVARSVREMLGLIKAGASELATNGPTPAVSSSDPAGDDLKAQIADLRKGYIGKINKEQQKINSSSGRVDAFFLRIGRHMSEFMSAAKAKGETREDYLYKSVVKDPTCKVKKGALYNAHTYFKTHSELIEKFGKAPEVPMTYYVKCRHKLLTLDEKHELLCMAEADKDVTAAKLNALVAEKLKVKGVGRKDPTPESQLLAHLTKALAFLTKAAGMIKKGVRPASDQVFILGKTVDMANACKASVLPAENKPHGQAAVVPVSESKAS